MSKNKKQKKKKNIKQNAKKTFSKIEEIYASNKRMMEECKREMKKHKKKL